MNINKPCIDICASLKFYTFGTGTGKPGRGWGMYTKHNVYNMFINTKV